MIKPGLPQINKTLNNIKKKKAVPNCDMEQSSGLIDRFNSFPGVWGWGYPLNPSGALSRRCGETMKLSAPAGEHWEY